MAGRPLPDYVEEEFDAYLKRGRMEEGFLRLRCERCHAEKLVAFSCKEARLLPLLRCAAHGRDGGTTRRRGAARASAAPVGAVAAARAAVSAGD
jgi:hypothetical protein